MRAFLAYFTVSILCLAALGLAWLVPGRDLRAVIGALLLWGLMPGLILARSIAIGELPTDTPTILSKFWGIAWAVKTVPLLQGIWLGSAAEHVWLMAVLYLVGERAVTELIQGPKRPTDDPGWRPNFKTAAYSTACLAVGIAFVQLARHAVAPHWR